ncbi:ankyrin repeat-containing protein [Heterostelium album PN500]|uniref:Ankyrin repeat-containing protein n=1 Tax=Heterostelium pallidum (strain ATCC 26659 / Pp 5 / PN500) TaxID=670386 RepID=D3B1P2_HETP5|nr:ankyrin repeat-containing protein [Heterostelium album PN500]EFA85216.1 ankyrin repeat-containing protein [Heterostelium album PN500]|eukprot:XP_020437325.1 ankyrin repeat-containing protein [Heterostelium album PN500]
MSNPFFSKTKKDDLFQAAKDGNLDQLKKFIEQDGMKPSDVDEDERTLLHWAASNGRIVIVQYLINECKQSVNTSDDGGWTPLLSAVSCGHAHMAKLLLENGADANCQNDSKRTPLHYASSKGKSDIVDLLLQHGAKSRKDDTGSAPIHRAAAIGNTAIIERLVSSEKNDINSTNVEGDTAAHIACMYGFDEVVHLLLSLGADFTMENNEQKKPYQLAGNSIKYIIDEIVVFISTWSQTFEFINNVWLTHILIFHSSCSASAAVVVDCVVGFSFYFVCLFLIWLSLVCSAVVIYCVCNTNTAAASDTAQQQSITIINPTTTTTSVPSSLY